MAISFHANECAPAHIGPLKSAASGLPAASARVTLIVAGAPRKYAIWAVSPVPSPVGVTTAGSTRSWVIVSVGMVWPTTPVTGRAAAAPVPPAEIVYV